MLNMRLVIVALDSRRSLRPAAVVSQSVVAKVPPSLRVSIFTPDEMATRLPSQ